MTTAGDNLKAPGRSYAGILSGDSVAAGLGVVMALATLALLLAGPALLTSAREGGWALTILSALGLWALWLIWRTMLADRDIPGHAFEPFLGAAILLLLAHQLYATWHDPMAGKYWLPRSTGMSLVLRLVALGLALMIGQDVLPRLPGLRWLLTALGLAAAVGAIARLRAPEAPAGGTALAMAGFAGVAAFLAPAAVPSSAGADPYNLSHRRYAAPAEQIARICAGAALCIVLMFSHYRAVSATALAAAVTGATLLAAGVVLGQVRRPLLPMGLLLLAGGVAALVSLGLPDRGAWMRPSLLGTGLAAEEVSNSDVPGARVLAAATGWIGLGLMAGGMATALLWSLWKARRHPRGDQGRAALWAVAAALSGAALLAPGGLEVPAVALAAAAIWGLLPHLLAHRVRRHHGLPVLVVFLALLVVVALQQRIAVTAWMSRLMQRSGLYDKTLHVVLTALLALALMWQFRCRRWWHGLAAAGLAVALGGAGEIAQELLSPRRAELLDVACNALGAALAAGVFLVLLAVRRLEELLVRRPPAGDEKYLP